MGVDIQTYRARIGTYSNCSCGDEVTVAKQVNIRDGVETVGCLIFIGILLVMAGIELNPGPREKESSRILEPIDKPKVKISGLNENINKDMLETFFEVEERHGGGKIKNIDIDRNTKCATLSFEEKTDFDAFVNSKPSSIFGNEVTVEIIDTTHIDTNIESRRIKISGLMEYINKEMLELFFEKEQTAGGGKVKYIDIDNKNKCVFVDFEEKSGVQWIMKKSPLSIFGMKVHTEIVETDIGEHTMIKITKLPAFISREMLKMFFEHKTDCGGNVVELTVNSEENYAIVEFDESEAVNKILAKRPLTIFEYAVEVDVFVLLPPKILESLNTPCVRITGLKEYVNKEMLETYFLNEEKHGGGKVRYIDIDNRNGSATIDFYDKSGIDAFVKRKSKSIFDMEVTVELIDVRIHSEEPKKIKITKLPVHMNCAMLTTFFESKKNYVGNVLDVTVDTEHHFAIVEFDNPTAVSKVMDKKSFTIFGSEVDVDVCGDKVSSETKPAERSMQPKEFLQTTDTSLVVEPRDIPRKRIYGQKENTNKDMLAMYSEHGQNKIGGQGNNTEMDQKVKFATNDFDEETVLLPPKILKSLNSPCVRITGLKEYVNKEMLETYFLNEEKHGGGKVRYIDIDNRNGSATIDFYDKSGIDAFVKRKSKSIFNMEVTVELIDVRIHSEEPKKIKITKLPVHMNCAMLTTFFESKRNYVGNVLDVTVDTEQHFAIIEFDNPTAVSKVMDKKSFTIFGCEVDVDVCGDKVSSETKPAERSMQPKEFLQTTDTSLVVEPRDIPRKRIYGQKENTNNMLAMYSEHGQNKIGGQGNNTEMDQKVKFATTDFDEETVLLPPKILKSLNTPCVRITGLKEYVNKEMLETYFLNEEKHGGGKVRYIDIDNRNGFATIDFYDKSGIDAFVKRKSKSIFDMEVTVELIDVRIHSEEPKKIKITKLPVHMNCAMLTTFFESKRNYVGNVLDVTVDTEHHFAIVEFDNPTAVSKVMDKKSFTIFGCEVDVDVCASYVEGEDTKSDKVSSETKPAKRSMQPKEFLQTTDTSLVVEPQDIPLKRIYGQKENTNKEMLAMYSEHGQNKIGGQGNDTEMDQKGKFATTDFDEETGTNYLACAESEQDYSHTNETGPTRFEDKEHESSHKHGSVTTQFLAADPVRSGITEENSSEIADIADSDGDIFWQMLQRLELTDKYPGKITIRDIIVIDPTETYEQQKRDICLVDIPWLVLRRLLCSHSEFQDISVSGEPNFNNYIGLDNTLSFISEMPDDKQDISPLDIFCIIFLCCDPFLKQLFVQKLYLCKIAVPFFYKYWENKEKCLPVLSVWSLRSLVIENKQQSDRNTAVQCKETDIMDLQTKMIAFGRFGRPRYSKSRLINSILSSQSCKTFFNIDCPSGMTQRKLSNGQIEMFWLPTIDDKKDRFQETMTFVNLRGAMEQHFDADSLSFVANFVDAVAIIVDTDIILEQGRVIKDILITFPSVILIFANPLKEDTIEIIQNFQKDVLFCKSDINIRVLSTHKGVIEQNVVDMVSSISQHIACHLKSSCSKSYQERFQQVCLQNLYINLRTDEEGVNCKIGNEEATKMIQQMKADGSSSSWKLLLTPVHCKFSKKLGTLIKKRERAKCFEDGNAIDSEIKKVRQDQTMNISTTVKRFASTLMRHKGNLYVLKYFLCWLHFYIEKEKRQTMPQLTQKNRQAWDELKDLKSKDPQSQSDIEKQEKIINVLEEKIDKASFSVQHFFREIGHIIEAILQLGKDDCTAFGLPPLKQMSNLVGRLIADGYQLELIDGESFYMPYKWIKSVVNEVDKCIGSGRVLALSVLGLQSSGKSTFLNTMFGCQFSTRTGRCTRGIHVQLIPANIAQCKDISSDYNFILVVDTEGLRSPELGHHQLEHDNELATVITGIGDITLINIMGENVSEIRDILQVIVHAFLRLKMANKDLDIKKSCSFIHQNVTDISASENMVSGLSILIQTLDEMTKESAKNEGISNITTFNQVIEFDINSQVWYLKNLWQGNPPMARVNTEYSERVVEIKSNVLQKALTMENKSYKSLKDVTEHAFNLWKGVLNEDFVFSFKNSIEIKAFIEMEHFVQKQLWHLESFIRENLIKRSRDSFANCEKKEELWNASKTITTYMIKLVFEEKNKRGDTIEKYFKCDKYKDIIIQWKKNQESRLDSLCQTLEQTIIEHVEKCFENRSIEILTNNCEDEHEEELRNMSMKVSTRNKNKTLSQEEINNLFDGVWQTFVKKVNTTSSRSEKNRKKMIDIFHMSLINKFDKHFSVLKKCLEQSQNLTPLPNVTTLRDTFYCTGIDENDINFTLLQMGAKWIKGASKAMSYIQSKLDEVFQKIDDYIYTVCRTNEELTETSVMLLMKELEDRLQAILRGENKYEFQVPFYVKIYVHVSRYAHAVFEKHNVVYFTAHGSAARLEKYRVRQKISFEAHLKCRYTEDVVSDLFIDVIKCFSEEFTSQNLSNVVFKQLYANMPAVKNTVIIEMCSDLLKKKDFSSFIGYIRDPVVYARSWLTCKANRYLFGEKQYAKLSSIMLEDVYSTVTARVSDVDSQYKGRSPIRTENWIEAFRKLMKDSKFTIKAEDFKSLKKETENINNLEYLTNNILTKLKSSKACLVSRFENTDSTSVKWTDTNPVDSYIQTVWGCQVQCPFCGEPCPNTKGHNLSNEFHTSIQHRPLCCIGNRREVTELASLESCNFLIQSDDKHVCGVFDYICNSGKREKCDKIHRFNDYKTHLKDWYISPSSNMHDNSTYWMWFVANYKEKLEEYYNYKLSHIPPTWNDITEDQALESLFKIYPTKMT